MKQILIIAILLIFCSCKSQENINGATIESKALMTKIFNDFENNENVGIDSNILYNLSSSDYKNWNELIEKSKHILKMAITYNAKSEEDRIDFTNIFTQKDVEYMADQALRVKSITWDKYLNIKPKDKQTHDFEKKYYLTIPVFSLNNEYALIYQEQKFGGALLIYKKTDGHWNAIGSCLIWIT